MSCVFPFSAIVGQNELKTALILNVIDPSIGGALIMGEKGTAKSTAVRALAALLPSYEANICHSGCDPRGHHLCSDCESATDTPTETRQMRVVELPLGTSEDRLVGSLDLEAALHHGKKRFEPGILAAANRNFLYVDEVNLLDDHLVDLLLDAAAMGTVHVEREGVSFRHPSRFVLVGSMNPEEGDLRPQLLDRFGLCVDVKALREASDRLAVLTRRMDFDKDHESFLVRYDDEQRSLAAKIADAKEMLPKVKLSEQVLMQIVSICAKLGLDGHRGDITLCRAATAQAAYDGCDSVEAKHIRAVASMVLLHRQKRQPFESASDANTKLQSALQILGAN